MKKTLVALAAATTTIGLVSLGTPAFATVPASNYSFTMAGNVIDQSGSATLTPAPECSSPSVEDICNNSSSFGTDEYGNYWTWSTTQGNGGGIVLTTPAPLGSTFSYSLKFSVSGVATDESGPDQNYSKLVDYGNLTYDDGVYFFGLGPVVVSTGYSDGSASFEIGQILIMTVTRDSSGLVTVYTKDESGFENALTYDDSSSQYFVAANSGPGSMLRLFQDEPESASETHEAVPGGKLYGFQAWADTALTEEQVREIGDFTKTPASLPNTGISSSAVTGMVGFSMLLALSGIAVTMGARRRRA